MTAFLHATLRALAFLSRLPPARTAFHGEHPLGADAHAFPVAGVVIALPGAVLLVGAAALGLSPGVAALLAVAATIAFTGALHEDGLADTADGLFGHHGRERALLIMRDSRIGVYGALALGLAVGLKVLLLAELVAVSPFAAALAFMAAAGASRGVMAHLWSSLPTAEPEGLAARVGAPDRRTGRQAAMIGAAILLLLGWPAAGIAGVAIAVLLALLVHLSFRRFLRRRLGGVTGDTIGCDQGLAEIAILLGFALVL